MFGPSISAGDGTGTWEFQGSNDNSNWSPNLQSFIWADYNNHSSYTSAGNIEPDLNYTYTAQAANSPYNRVSTYIFNNTSSYLYYRMNLISGALWSNAYTGTIVFATA